MFTSKHRIDRSNSLQGLFILDLSDRLSCNTLLHVAMNLDLQPVFLWSYHMLCRLDMGCLRYGVNTTVPRIRLKSRSLGELDGPYVLLRHNYDISGPMRSRVRPIHALVQNDFDIRSLLSLLPRNSLDIPYLTHILDRESYLWFKTIEKRLFGGLLLFMDPTCWQSKSFHYIQKD